MNFQEKRSPYVTIIRYPTASLQLGTGDIWGASSSYH